MKTAILTPTFSQFSGPDRVVLNEALELATAGEDVTIITFRTDFDPTQLPKKVSVETFGMPKNPLLERIYRLFFFVDVLKVNRIVKKLQQFDRVISFLYPMTLPAMLAKKKKPALKYTYYDVGIAYPKLFESSLERIYLKMFANFTKRTVKNADSAISISKFCSSELKKETGLVSQVKYVKIDSERFNAEVSSKYEKQIAAATKTYELEEPVLLYVGRLSPHKGVHLLLEAFRIVKEKRPSATLVIVGKHTFRKYSHKLQQAAAEIGGVVFTGFIPDKDLPTFYGSCNVYVTCSMWEGFDIPIVEANACGKPAVAFNVGSHPEVLKKGELVEAGNVTKFAEAVLKVAS